MENNNNRAGDDRRPSTEMMPRTAGSTVLSDEEEALPISQETFTPWQAFVKILKMAVPMGCSWTFNLSMLLIGIFIGHLKDGNETNNLGGSTLITITLNMLAVITIGMQYASGIEASRKYGRLQQLKENGRENSEEAVAIRKELATLPRNTLLISLPFFLGGVALYFSKSLLIALGQSAGAAAVAATYLQAAIGIVPLLAIRMSMEQLIFGFKHQYWVMGIALFSFTIGIFVAAILGFGLFSSPKLGVVGFAYGFTFESILTCVGFALFLAFHPDFKEIHFLENFFKLSSHDRQQITRLLRIGIPIQCILVNEVIAQFMIGLFAGWLGPTQIAAQNFSYLFQFFATTPQLSFGQSTCLEMSSRIGLGEYDNANRLARYGLRASLAVMFVFCMIVIASPRLLVSVAAQHASPAIVSLAQNTIPIRAAGMFVYTALYHILQTSRAAHDLVVPPRRVIFSLWVGIPTAYGLGYALDLYGIEMAYALIMIVGTLWNAPRWREAIKPETLATVIRRSKQSSDSKSYAALPCLSLVCCCNEDSEIHSPLLSPSSSSINNNMTGKR